MRRWIPAICLLLVTLPVAAQPDRLFEPGTVMVARIELRRWTPDRVEEAVATIGGEHEVIRQTLAAQAARLGPLLEPLRSAGIETVHVVGTIGGGGVGYAWCAPLRGPPEGFAAQVERMRGAAGRLGLRADQVGGWVALRAQPPTGASGEPIVVDDAPFLDALASQAGPDGSAADAVVAFVPTDAVRAMLRDRFDAMVAGEPAADRPVLAKLGRAIDADWYVIAARLGAAPRVEVRAQMGSADGASGVVAASRSWQSAAKTRIRRGAEQTRADERRAYDEAVADYQAALRAGRRARPPERDPDIELDERPMLEMVDALRAEQQGDRAAVRLDRDDLQAIAAGMAMLAEQMAKGIVDAMTEPEEADPRGGTR